MTERIVRSAPSGWRRLALLTSLLLTSLLLLLTPPPGVQAVLIFSSVQASEVSNKAPQPEAALVALEPGKPIERQLAGGQSHSYQVTLAAGQYLHVVVDQRGVDVVVTLFGPDGKKMAEVDSPNGTQGPEPVSLVAEAKGIYRLEVRSLENDAAAGLYKVRVEALRTATPQDSSRIAAEKAFAEGEDLRAQRTAEALQKGIEKYQQALPLWQAAGDHRREAETLNRIGNIYSLLGENQKALDYSARAVPLARAAGDRREEALALHNIGTVHSWLGEKQTALGFYTQALPLWRAVADRRGEAETLNNIGTLYDDLGEKQKALDHYNQALPLWRAVGDRRGEARTLHNIGTSHDELGEEQKALEFYIQALSLWRAESDRRGEAYTLTNIGTVYSSLGEKRKALDYYSQALPLRRAVGDRRGEAATLTSIGKVYGDLGDKQKALESYEQALPLNRAVGDRRNEAKTLSLMGAVYASLGEREKALDHLGQAVRLNRAVGDRAGEAATLYHIARVERDRSSLAEARGQIEAALKIIESLRAKVGSQELRASYLASVQENYDFYIELLMRLDRLEPGKGFDALALQASERARARSLLELLTESRADIRQGVDAALLDRERSLQQLLSAKVEGQMRLLSGKHTEEQAAAAAKEIEALTIEYEQVEAQIKATSPRYAALTQPQPLTVSEIQQKVLDPETLLLEYALGEEKSFLWAVTPTSLKSYELPKRAVVEGAARRVYELLAEWERKVGEGEAPPASAETDYWKSAANLSRMLLGPAAGELANRRLLIVSDGALQYIPFAALTVPGSTDRPLVTEHEIVSLPSTSTLAVLRAELAGRGEAARKTLAVLADPVFDRDDRRVRTLRASGKRVRESVPVSRGEGATSIDYLRSARDLGLSDGSLPRLPFTRREAKAILSLVPLHDRKEALDFDANQETATASELGHYRLIHFATHGFLNSRRPELSGIVLSLVDRDGNPRRGYLPASEIFNLKLPADLVVLSGCRTGLGKEIRGEGLIGLTRAFMYAGAARVAASLWNVSDRATAELMRRFYQEMLGERHLRPAAALREAQISLWKQKRWNHPYYWASFVLQGEWN